MDVQSGGWRFYATWERALVNLRTSTLAAPVAGDPSQVEPPDAQARERRNTGGMTDADGLLAPPAPLRLPVQDAGVSIAAGDWDDLFSAVQERLTHIVSDHRYGLVGASTQGAAQIRDWVLECVAALRTLQSTVTAERARGEGLEAAFFEAQASLAQVRAALVGTQQEERRARYDASHDALTQLPNRGLLLERITRQLTELAASPRMFAVMFLDLDGFKCVNDDQGHSAGDALLCIVAARLRRVVRVRDVVSRVGRDEFACVIGGVDDHAQLTGLADKMAQAISAPCDVGGIKLVVHASIGIATCPADGRTADQLLKHADLAMYKAKREGSRYAFFQSDDTGATVVRSPPLE
jgi:diguanylate cyclase (GGDEF)-like protein